MSDTSARRIDPEGTPSPHDVMTLGGQRFVPMISPQDIAVAIDRIAGDLTLRHFRSVPILLGVLSGAAPFHADLARRLEFPLELDYIRVSSYRGGIAPSGEMTIAAHPSTQMAGRNVIVVDDIVDTGGTLRMLVDYVVDRGASLVETAALLYKPGADTRGALPDYVGFHIPDVFVVGYGLDYHGLGRNLPGVMRWEGALEQE